MSFRTWCWLDSSYSLSYYYIKVIYCFIASTSPDIRAEAIQDPALLHTFLNPFCGRVELIFEKVKREIFKGSVRCFIRNTGKFTSLKHSLLVLQVKTNTARYEGLLGSRCHNFRHLQHSCSSAANLSRRYCSKLSFRLFFFYSWNTFYCSVSTILKAMALEQDPSSRLENFHVVRKKASTLSTLHGIANCAKNWTTRKIVSSNRCQCLAAVSPITTFGQVWESCSQHF